MQNIQLDRPREIDPLLRMEEGEANPLNDLIERVETVDAGKVLRAVALGLSLAGSSIITGVIVNSIARNYPISFIAAGCASMSAMVYRDISQHN